MLSWAVPLLFLWLHLIRHLSVEWSLNPQYHFGWAVPPLCLFFVYRKTCSARTGPPGLVPPVEPAKPTVTVLAFGFLLALAYAPIRLVEEANPEWRLVSWALALDVAGLTLLILPLLRLDRSSAAGRFPDLAGFGFPVLFFLVSVPWPTAFERYLIHLLTSVVGSVAVELLGLLGMPALLHGKVIEIASGALGLEDACSGIRSFQASVMVALVFGEICGLPVGLRWVLVSGGLVLAVLSNLLRTTLLAVLAFRCGLSSLNFWHDPVSTSAPAVCFGGVAGLAFLLRSRLRREARNWQGIRIKVGSAPAPSLPAVTALFSNTSRISVLFALAFLVWIGLVELGNEAWYRHQERELPPPIGWHFELPRDQPEFRELSFAAETRRLLRFDQGLNAAWADREGWSWQAIFLRWNPGRTAVYLARNHTPEDCLVAAGHPLTIDPTVYFIPVKGLDLPFRRYAAFGQGRPLYVFYCLWEDRALARSVSPAWLSYRNRLRPVLVGTRQSGQRSLELAIWGPETAEAAQTVVQALLERSLAVE